jgi:hypothetical protein
MRREFSSKTKLAAWQRSGGRCEAPDCGLYLTPGKFIYDHRIPDQLGGEPTLENCQVICSAHDKEKTRKDAGDIARAKRREQKHLGIKRPRTIRQWRRFDGTRVYAARER